MPFDPTDPFASAPIIPQTSKPRQMPSGGSGGGMLDDPLADPSLDPMAEPDQTDDPAFPVNDSAEGNPSENFPPKSSMRRLAEYVRKTNPDLSEVEANLLAQAAGGVQVDTSNIIPPGMAPRLPAIPWGQMLNRGLDEVDKELKGRKVREDLSQGLRPGQQRPGYFDENKRFKPWTVEDQINNSNSGPYQPTVDPPYNKWAPPKGPRVRPEGDDIIDAEIVPNKTYAPKGEPQALAPDKKMIEPGDHDKFDQTLDPKPRDVPPYLGDVNPQKLEDVSVEDYPNQNNDLSHPDIDAPEQTNGGHPDAPNSGRPAKPDKSRDSRGRPIIPPMKDIY